MQKVIKLTVYCSIYNGYVKNYRPQIYNTKHGVVIHTVPFSEVNLMTLHELFSLSKTYEGY